jgi:Tfp pilus assembly protein PilN
VLHTQYPNIDIRHRYIQQKYLQPHHNMEHRIQQLELKLAEQERANAAMCDDIKSLEDIRNGDRREYHASFEHYEKKKKKFSTLLKEANASIVVLQEDQQTPKAELQYVYIVLCYRDQMTDIC